MSGGIVIAVNRKRKRRFKEKLSMSEWCWVHLIIRSYIGVASMEGFCWVEGLVPNLV